MKLGFGIPTLNRYDLLKEALSLYETNLSKNLAILDNGKQKISISPWYTLYESGHNLGVSGSWNFLINQFEQRECTHICLLNDDIVWHKNTYEIEQFIVENPADFYMGTYAAFTIFVVPLTTYKSIGPFDRIFHPAYYEDNDYVYRLRLQDKTIIQHEFFDADVFRESQTLRKSPELERNEENCRHYIHKWGGPPGYETFRIPYNLGVGCGKMV